ncbi:MAG: HAD-IA family hydrolase, partial [Endomicrobiales bacterium]
MNNAFFTKTISILMITGFIQNSDVVLGLSVMINEGSSPVRLNTAFNDSLIPTALGKITDAYCREDGHNSTCAAPHHKSDPEQIVVLIQDLHCNPEVQRNINGILSSLDKKYGFKKIFVEGGIGQVNTSWVNAIHELPLRKQIVETFMDSGQLSGAEYFSITNGTYNLLHGLEDEKLYRENIMRYDTLLNERSEIEVQLDPLRKTLATLQRRYYGPGNKKLEQFISRQRDGTLKPEKYYRLLIALARFSGIDLYQYPNLTRFRDLSSMYDKLNCHKSGKQMRQLMTLLKQRLPFRMYNDLMGKIKDPSRVDELYQALAELARENPQKFSSAYPELSSFLSYKDQCRFVAPMELVREDQQLVGELQRRFCASSAEKDVVLLTGYFRRFEQYMNGRVPSDDYNFVNKHSDEFTLLWAKYALNAPVPALTDYGNRLETFYKVNLARNQAFIKNVFGFVSPTLAPNLRLVTDVDVMSRARAVLDGKKELIVMVAGGFHTAGITGLLKSYNVSYVVITPGVTKEAPATDTVYTDMIRGEARLFSAQTITALVSELLKPYTIDDVALRREIESRYVDIILNNMTAKISPEEALMKLKSADLGVLQRYDIFTEVLIRYYSRRLQKAGQLDPEQGLSAQEALNLYQKESREKRETILFAAVKMLSKIFIDIGLEETPVADVAARVALSLSNDNSPVAEKITAKDGIIFDLDGTLHSSDDLLRASREKVIFGILPKLKGVSFEEGKKQYLATEMKLKSGTRPVSQRDIFEALGLDWKTVLKAMDDLSGTIDPREYISPDPQLVAYFRALSRTHRCAVLSNSGRELVKKTLAALGILEFFDVIVTRTELGEDLKPSPRAFMTVLERLGIEKNRVTVVGDDVQKDILPAEKLGLTAFRVTDTPHLYQVMSQLLLNKLLREGAAPAPAPEVGGAIPLKEAIAHLTGDTLSDKEMATVDLLLRMSLAFYRGSISREYFYTVVRSAQELGWPLITSALNARELFPLVSPTGAAITLNVPASDGGITHEQGVVEDELAAAIRYLKMMNLLTESIEESRLLHLIPPHILEISPSDAGKHPGSALLAASDANGVLHVYTDPLHGARTNIRQVPDMDRSGMDNRAFDRATEIVPLRGYKSPTVHVRKFRGWNLLPDELKRVLTDMFARNVVPLTLHSGEAVRGLAVALETSRQNNVAPGRTGPLLFNDGLVVVKDASGRQLLLDIKGVGPYDGTFELRERTIFRGVVDGQKLMTHNEVGRGFLTTANATADTDHLRELDREPPSLVSIQAVPAFQVDFEIEGRKFSLMARLSPGNRRLGQYWVGADLQKDETFRNADLLGKSVAGMLLERRPVVHRAFMMENFLDPLAAFSGYANPGSVTSLDSQRRAFDTMERWLVMSEQRVTHKWGHEKEPEDTKLAQQFWNGFLDIFIGVAEFSPAISQRLDELKRSPYSEAKWREILSLVWDNYIVQRIFEARSTYGYNPEKFMQPTYSGEMKILPPMPKASDWVWAEMALYDTLLASEYGKRHANRIREQKNHLIAVVRENYPAVMVEIIRRELIDEFNKESRISNTAAQEEIKQVKDAFMTLLERLKVSVDKGEIVPNAPVNLVGSSQDVRVGDDGRESRFGVLALSTDPIEWGDLYVALSSMLRYKFDKIIVLGPGKREHTPGMQPAEHRQRMIEMAVSLFSPFIEYSPIGIDDYHLDEEHFFDLAIVNSGRRAGFYYISGDGSKESKIRVLSNLMEINAKSLKSARPVRLGAAFTDGQKAEEVVPAIDHRLEVLNEEPDVQAINGSSLLISQQRAFHLSPLSVREYIIQHQLFTKRPASA